MSNRHSSAVKEPWVLVASINKAKLNPVLIVNIYRQSIRIEENIRDTKCLQYDFYPKVFKIW